MADFSSRTSRDVVAGVVTRVVRDLTSMGERAETLAAQIADPANPTTNQEIEHALRALRQQMAALAVVDGLAEGADLLEGLDVLARHVPADFAGAEVTPAPAVLAARAEVVLDLRAFDGADLWSGDTDTFQPLAADDEGSPFELPATDGALRILIPRVDAPPWVAVPWSRMRAITGHAAAGAAAAVTAPDIDNGDQLFDAAFGVSGDPRAFHLRMTRGAAHELMIAQRVALPSPVRLQIATLAAA